MFRGPRVNETMAWPGEVGYGYCEFHCVSPDFYFITHMKHGMVHPSGAEQRMLKTKDRRPVPLVTLRSSRKAQIGQHLNNPVDII